MFSQWEKAAKQHDRAVLCIDIKDDQIVTGSADHALHLYALRNLNFQRRLFDKSCGHSEWVTQCQLLPNGGVISGGMDGDLCLWSKLRGVHLKQHRSSISHLLVDNDVCFSSGYDQQICVWNLKSASCLTSMRTSSVVTRMYQEGALLVTGERDGKLSFYDLEKPSSPLLSHSHCHTGQINLIESSSRHGLFATGGQLDGRVSLWPSANIRTPLWSERLQNYSLNFLRFVGENGIVVGDGEGYLTLLDLRMIAEERRGEERRGIVSNLKVSSGILCGDLISSSQACLGLVNGDVVILDFNAPSLLKSTLSLSTKSPVHSIKAYQGSVVAGCENGEVWRSYV